MRQDYILPSTRIRSAEGRLVFGSVNEGGFELLIDTAGDDPDVWYSEAPGTAVATEQPLSGFLLQFLLGEAALVSPFGAFASVPADQQHWIERLLQRVPMSPVRWPTGPTSHYVGPGVVAMVR